MRITTPAARLAILCAVFLGGPAHAVDLTGLWTTNVDDCDKVFETKGGRASFRQDADLYGSGFIIEGNRIRGPTTSCTVTKTKEENDVVHMIASCATEIMYQNMQFS